MCAAMFVTGAGGLLFGPTLDTLSKEENPSLANPIPIFTSPGPIATALLPPSLTQPKVKVGLVEKKERQMREMREEIRRVRAELREARERRKEGKKVEGEREHWGRMEMVSTKRQRGMGETGRDEVRV